MSHLPLYENYAKHDRLYKSGIIYNYLTRDTLPWKLSCEEAGKTKQLIVDSLTSSNPRTSIALDSILENTTRLQYVVWIAFLLLLASFDGRHPLFP